MIKLLEMRETFCEIVAALAARATFPEGELKRPPSVQDVLKCGPAEVLEMCQARHHAGLVHAFADAGCQIGGGVSAGHTGGTMEAAAAAVARGGHARLLHVVRQLAGAHRNH